MREKQYFLKDFKSETCDVEMIARRASRNNSEAGRYRDLFSEKSQGWK
jgi:hypothetical protein